MGQLYGALPDLGNCFGASPAHGRFRVDIDKAGHMTRVSFLTNGHDECFAGVIQPLAFQSNSTSYTLTGSYACE